jgi:hypothetical protein
VTRGELAGLLQVQDGAADHQDRPAHATPYSGALSALGSVIEPTPKPRALLEFRHYEHGTGSRGSLTRGRLGWAGGLLHGSRYRAPLAVGGSEVPTSMSWLTSRDVEDRACHGLARIIAEHSVCGIWRW